MITRIVEFDIDGTLTEDVAVEQEDRTSTYTYRRPNLGVIELVRQAYASGWTVTIHTGRREEQRRVTEQWLAEHRVPYHFLFMGKPPCNFRIDDVNVTAVDFKRLLDTETTLWQK